MSDQPTFVHHRWLQLLILGCVLAWGSNLQAATKFQNLLSDQNVSSNIRNLIVVLNRTTVENGGELSDTLNLLQASQDSVRVRQALGQLLPELSTQQVLRQGHLNTWRHQQRRFETRSQRPARHASNYVQWLNSGALFKPDLGIWIEGFADSSKQDNRDGINGFDANSRGVGIGFERDITNSSTLGIAYARATADADSNRFGRDNITSSEYSVYNTLYFGNGYLSSSISFSSNQTDRIRVIRIETDAGSRFFTLRSNIDASQYSGGVSLGWNKVFPNNITLSPFISINYSKLKTDDYVEHGAGELNLVVDTNDEKQLIGGIGLSLGYTRETANWLITPELHVSFAHDFKSDASRTFSHFRDVSRGFDSKGYSVETDRLRAGASISLSHFSGFSLQLGVDAETRNDYRHLAGLLDLRYGF